MADCWSRRGAVLLLALSMTSMASCATDARPEEIGPAMSADDEGRATSTTPSHRGGARHEEEMVPLRPREDRLIPATAPVLTVRRKVLRPFYTVAPGDEGTGPPAAMVWPDAARTAELRLTSETVPIRVVIVTIDHLGPGGIPADDAIDDLRCTEHIESFRRPPADVTGGCDYWKDGDHTVIRLDLEARSSPYLVLQASFVETPLPGSTSPPWRPSTRSAGSRVKLGGA